MDEALSGDEGEINWGATALLFSRLSADMSDIGRSYCTDGVLSIFEKVDCFTFYHNFYSFNFLLAVDDRYVSSEWSSQILD